MLFRRVACAARRASDEGSLRGSTKATRDLPDLRALLDVGVRGCDFPEPNPKFAASKLDVIGLAGQLYFHLSLQF